MSEREYFERCERFDTFCRPASVPLDAHFFRRSYKELPPLLGSGDRLLAFDEEKGGSEVLHNTEYTLSILLSLSKNGIKSSSSESVMSSNQDCTGTWNHWGISSITKMKTVMFCTQVYKMQSFTITLILRTPTQQCQKDIHFLQ